MVFELIDDTFEVIQLLFYFGFVAIIKSMSFVLQPHPKHHGESVFLRIVENGLGFFNAPSSDGISANIHYDV